MPANCCNRVRAKRRAVFAPKLEAKGRDCVCGPLGPCKRLPAGWGRGARAGTAGIRGCRARGRRAALGKLRHSLRSWQPPVPVPGLRARQGGGHGTASAAGSRVSGREEEERLPHPRGQGLPGARGGGSAPSTALQIHGALGNGDPRPRTPGHCGFSAPPPLLSCHGHKSGLPSSRCDPMRGHQDPAGKGAAGPRVGTSPP